MKQLIIGKNVAYPTSSFTDLTAIADGAVGLYNLRTGAVISANSGLTDNFAVVCGRANTAPIVFSEVDVKSLRVAKATYAAGTKFKCKFTVPTPSKGKIYTVIVIKKGTVFNERANWTFTTMAKDELSASVATALVKQINANSSNLEVTASNTGGVVTIEAANVGKDFEVVFADELLGLVADEVVAGKKAILDKAYVKDLASRCAAGKGFNYTYADGDSIYPGYPENVDADQYVLYSLRFAVPRVAAKQRDEVVWQTLHIALPVGAAAITTLDGIFKVTDVTDYTDVDCSEDPVTPGVGGSEDSEG